MNFESGLRYIEEPASFTSFRKLMSIQGVDRIESNPDVLSGQPVIRGTRLPVYVIIEALAEGDSIEDLEAAYPFLEKDDIRQALRFAARMSQVEYVEA